MFDVTETGKRIKELRGKTSQDKCAKDLGISRGALSYYENGERKPDAELLYRMSEYFGVSADYILGLSNTMTIDKDIQTACKVTGLNEETILKLESEKKEWENQTEGNGIAQIETYFYVRNQIISSQLFENIIYNCCELYENSISCLNNWEFPFYYISEFAKKIDVLENKLLLHIKNSVFDAIISNEGSERCDLDRYNIFKSAEKISDMFDKRDDYMNFSKEETLKYLKIDSKTLHKMQQEDNNNG